MNIAISCGDVNGIGLEVLFKALARRTDYAQLSAANLELIVHPQTALDYARALGLDAVLENSNLRTKDFEIRLIACVHQAQLHFGREEPGAAHMAFEALEIAAARLMSSASDAVVTLPVSKHALHSVGFSFPGQTEFFAERCAQPGVQQTSAAGAAQALMILMHKQLRVALATVHVPLQSVASLLSVTLLCERASALHRSLQRDFALDAPRIAVLGLNPHAGEQGHIGREELEIIAPAVELMQASGINANGPHAADGFFAHGAYREYDGILAMYHDQGLIPLKLLAGGAGVNFSADLDVVRCSPDHGTAYMLAGKNIADPESTLQALCSAADIVSNRRR